MALVVEVSLFKGMKDFDNAILRSGDASRTMPNRLL